MGKWLDKWRRERDITYDMIEERFHINLRSLSEDEISILANNTTYLRKMLWNIAEGEFKEEQRRQRNVQTNAGAE